MNQEEIIEFLCPNGHKLSGPASLQGRPGQCPHCQSKFVIPDYSEFGTETDHEAIAALATTTSAEELEAFRQEYGFLDVFQHPLLGYYFPQLGELARQSEPPEPDAPVVCRINKRGTAVPLDLLILADQSGTMSTALLKPLLTSLTLAGGGSGGIFAPSIFIGATLGASFGLVCNLWLPGFSADPGVYAIVGMGAVVAGTTHGLLGAILIVYELTNDYRIILPIMVTAESWVAITDRPTAHQGRLLLARK